MRGLFTTTIVLGVVTHAQTILPKEAPSPLITPAPRIEQVEEWLLKRQSQNQDLDAISLATVLLTALPSSLRALGATNLPAASSAIASEFAKNERPEWFKELPVEIQEYLVRRFTGDGGGNGGGESFDNGQWTTSFNNGQWTTSFNDGMWSTTRTSTGGEGGSKTTSGYSTIQTGTEVSSASTRPSSSASSSPPSSSLSSSSSSSPTRSTRPSTSSLTPLSSPSSASESSTTSFLSSTSLSSTFSTSAPTSSSSTSSATSPPDAPDAPPVSSNTLSRTQKIGLGVGIPLGLLTAAAFFLTCCLLLRRRRRHKEQVNGAERPSSPGFIPRFAFHEKSGRNSKENIEHRTRLTGGDGEAGGGTTGGNWEDEGVDPWNGGAYDGGAYGMSGAAGGYPPPSSTTKRSSNPYTLDATVDSYAATYDAIHESPSSAGAYPEPVHHYTPSSSQSPPNPIRPNPTPLINFHSHSSNRARGMRMSYSSLRSVAEVTEPDDSIVGLQAPDESPILGRSDSSTTTMAAAGGVGLLQQKLKRKPVSTPPPPSPPTLSPPRPPFLTTAASNSHSWSSSSGLALTTTSTPHSVSTGATSTSSIIPPTSPLSPVSPSHARPPSNPFSYDSYNYIEDYGPEYSFEHDYSHMYPYSGHQHYNHTDPNHAAPQHTSTFNNFTPNDNDNFIDIEDGLYGNTSLSRYPNPEVMAEAAAGGRTRRKSGGSERRGSKGSRGSREWPLRSMVGSIGGGGAKQRERERRNSRPLWEGLDEE